MLRRRIRRRGANLVVGATICVALAIIAYLTFSSVIQQREASLQVRHTLEVIARARRIQEVLVEMQTGVSDYVLLRDAAVLRAGDQAHTTLQTILRELEPLVAENLAQMARLSSLAAAVQDWRSGTAIQTLQAADTGRRDDAIALARESRQVVSAMRALVDRFAKVEEELLRDQTRTHEGAYEQTRLLLVKGALLVLVIGVGLLILLDTERRRGEQVLMESEERTRAILDHTVDGIITIDERGVIQEFNPSAERIFGYSAVEMVGRKVNELMPLPYREQHDTYLARYLATRESGVIGTVREVSGCRRDGTLVLLELSMSEVVLHRQRLFTGIVRDISERKAVERMKDEFVSIVSHELRTPLTSIRGALGLLAGGTLGHLPESGRRMLEVAVTNTDRLVRLINDLLDMERIESGRVQLRRQAYIAGDLMLQASEVMRPMAEKAGVRIEMTTNSDRLWVDSDRVIQTLTNLLSNAIKFSPPGTTIRLGAERRDAEILFHVRDQGRGIPADKRETIFGRFQQVDASDAREKGGTGLGLAICRSLVEQHGGRIWVESTPGEGSTFFFTLPRLAERTATARAEFVRDPRM
ncbi:MAG: ATP-binding protein [candidate division NC10 bacterium]